MRSIGNKSMIKIGLVIPWREQPSRVGLFKEVKNWYKTNLPDIEVFYADRPGEFWNCAASRNDGVKRAQEAHCDVVIINDADTLPEIEPLMEAIKSCQQSNMIHNPYSACKVFSKEETFRFYDGVKIQDIHCRNVFALSNGGVYVCTPEAWWSMGGQDEKFVQWGFEDSAFEVAHIVLKGIKIVKHDGYIYSLKHQEQFHDKGYNENYHSNHRLYMRYLRTLDPNEMLKLVKEPKNN
jgi:predicted glycosyltransferase involved in capsule biosynthesis